MRPLHRLLLPGCALLLGAVAAHAEGKSASFRFLTFDRDDTTPLVATTGENALPVERPHARFGLPVRLHGVKGTFSLYPAAKAGAGAEMRPPAPALQFHAPPGPRNLVIIFAAGDKRVGRAIADNPRQFPFASTLVINLTKSRTAFTLAGRRAELKPGESTLLHPEITDEPAEAPVRVARLADGDEKLLYGTVWVLRKDCRNLVILSENAEGACLVRVVADRRAQLTEEAPPDKPEKPAKAR